MALAVLGWLVEGPTPCDAVRADLLAAAHLAVVVTALAFVLWYGAVARLGAARAGLFTGVVPVTAAVVVLLGGPAPAPWCGRGWRWSPSGWRRPVRARRDAGLCGIPNTDEPGGRRGDRDG